MTTALFGGGRWLEPLVTAVTGLHYDFVSRTGRLNMPDCCCCDMDGCIALFKRIDPKVRCIQTFAGDTPDTKYVRNWDGEWESLRYRNNQDGSITILVGRK